MSPITVTTASGAPHAVPGRGSALWRMTVVELKLLSRERVRLVFGLGFPPVLLVVLGSVRSFSRPSRTFGGRTTLDVYVPILIAFSVALLALTALPPALADYRERGVLRRLRTTPAGPARVLAAQLLLILGISVVSGFLLLVLARLGYDVPMPQDVGGFVLAAALAFAALTGIGLFIASAAPNARAAQATGTILFYPMMFFGGLWLPLAAMPRALRRISHATPLGAAVQALQDSAQGQRPHTLQIVTLLAWAVVLTAASARAFRRE